jgi:Subtilase family
MLGYQFTRALCISISLGSANCIAKPIVYPSALSNYVAQNPKVLMGVFVTAKSPLNEERAGLLERLVGDAQHNGEAFRLPLINSMAGTLRGEEIGQLMEDESIKEIWYYIDTGHFADCVRIIEAIAYAVDRGVPLLNLSSTSPEKSFRDDEPVNLATRAAFDAGSLIIVAAGNDGPAAGTVSAWCSPWVVCVGATTNNGAELASFSARAAPGDAVLPTVVAPGYLIVEHPKDVLKTTEMLDAERRINFADVVPRDQQELYTVVSGTSYATPQVSRIAALILFYLQHRLQGVANAGTTFDVEYDFPLRRTPDPRTTVARGVGTMRSVGSNRVATYPGEPSAGLLRQIIMDLAVGVGDYDSSAIGAGFVSWENALHVFGQYGQPPPKIMPLKVFQ